MQELAQEAALQADRNVWVDGSLGDHDWFTQAPATQHQRLILNFRCLLTSGKGSHSTE